MKQIFKNYLATFIKNWLQTIGTVLFILMMAAVVIGFLAAPLQIYNHIRSMNDKNNHYTQIVSDQHFKYNSRFLYKTIYNDEDYYASKGDTADNDDTSMKIMSAIKKDQNGNGFLSAIYKKAVELDVNAVAKKDASGNPTFSTNRDKYDAYANYINNGINLFRDGALVKTNAYFNLQWNQNDDATKAFTDNIDHLIRSDVTSSSKGLSDKSVLSRMEAKLNAVLSVNSFSSASTDLIQYIASQDSKDVKIFDYTKWSAADDGISTGNVVLTLMKNELWKADFQSRQGDVADLPSPIYKGEPDLSRMSEKDKSIQQSMLNDTDGKNPKDAGKRKIYLISSQVYNDFDGSSFYNIISDIAPAKDVDSNTDWAHQIHYSNDLLNYVVQRNWSANDGANSYNPYYERNVYLSETSSSSLFPTLGIELYTVNNSNDPNQLQLVEGNRPDEVKWTSLQQKTEIIKQIANGTYTPDIVINSGFANNNHLHVGDYITLPDSKEHNNVSSMITGNFGDDALTSKLKYRISGIGEKFDNSTPGNKYIPFMEDIKTYANGYIDDGFFTLLREAQWNNTSSASGDFGSSIRFVKTQDASLDPVYAFAPHNDSVEYNDGVFDNSIAPFINYNRTRTMQSLNSLKIRVIIFIILGVAVLALAFIFINFIITKELNETRRQIGIFKSFGYNIAELSWIFAVKTFLTIFVGMILGYIVSIPLQIYSAGNYLSSVMFKFDKIFASGGFLPIIFLVIPTVFLLLSYVMTLFYLAEPTLSLLSNGSKVKKGKVHTGPLIKFLAKRQKGFGYRLQQAFVKNSKGKFIVIQVLFAVASLVFTLMFGAQTLMYSVANQGFSVLTKNADHKYNWSPQDHININYDSKDKKYSLQDPKQYETRKFQYKAYSGDQAIGDVLNNDADMSDSRYRENFLISSIANTFDVSKNQALEMLMPLDYYLVKNAGVKPADLPNIVYGRDTGKGLIDSSNPIYSFYKDAADADAKIDKLLVDQEIAYHNYYLNWILTFRIGIMKDETSSNIMGVNDIKKDLINGNNKNEFKLDNLIKYINSWDDVYNKDGNNPIRIKLQDLTDNQDKIKGQFKDTLFGMSDTTGDKKNNLFLSDITKIITLELAESYATTKYSVILGNNNSPVGVANALAKTKQDSVMKEFTPNEMKYWGMQNNPLVDMSAMMGGDSSKSKSFKAEKVSGSNTSASTGGGLSLSKMNAQTVSLVMAAAMLGYNSSNIQDMPVATINEAFFNKDTETLFYDIPVTGVDDTQASGSNISLFKYDDSYGKYDTSLTHDGISDATMKELANDSSIDGTINAAVPYGLAKYRKLKVGDVFTVYSNTDQKRPIKLHIIGINKSEAMSLGSGWGIDADYDQFAKHYFNDDLRDKLLKQPIFNRWYSNEPMLEGNINLKDIPGSINTMRYVGKNLSISIAPGSSIFGSIFSGLVDFSSLSGAPIDANYMLITNPNIASTSNLSSVLPFNILKAGVDQGLNEINNILILFMCLVAILLLIILVLVMNIIVEQATPIILTLKSLGYRQREINWITMGSYIIGAVISFFIAYGLSLLIWNVFLIVAANLWHIYVFMAYSWQAPVITFLVISAILFIGWFASDQKVEKIPLTLVTGFN